MRETVYSLIDIPITIIDNYKAPASQFQHQPRVFHYNQNFSTYGCKLSRYQKHGKKIFRFEGDKTIKLRSQAFIFDIPQSNSAIFYINFDAFFNIESVLFESNSKDMGKFSFTKIKLNFDKNLTLIDYDYSYVELRNKIDISIKKDLNKLMSFDDEVILWQLFNHQSDEVKYLIPEYHIPSAYNFKHPEFIDRLNVLSMLIL